MHGAIRLMLGVLCVVLVVFAVFGVMYFVVPPGQTTVPEQRLVQLEDWCGVSVGQGPHGVDAVLCVSSQPSGYILVTRPSMYTQDDIEEGLVQQGPMTSIQPWARSDTGEYEFFRDDGVHETALHCRFDLSGIGAPLVFVPVAIGVPIDIQALLPVREDECPAQDACGSGMHRMFRQTSVLLCGDVPAASKQLSGNVPDPSNQLQGLQIMKCTLMI
jgi:hypothetical protein